jgi:hypothetical protein
LDAGKENSMLWIGGVLLFGVIVNVFCTRMSTGTGSNPVEAQLSILIENRTPLRIELDRRIVAVRLIAVDDKTILVEDGGARRASLVRKDFQWVEGSVEDLDDPDKRLFVCEPCESP